MARSLQGRNVVVTGGTGALGGAVVARLIAEGVICHLPSSRPAAPAGFPFSGDARVRLVNDVDLTDALAVDAFFDGISSLWASIHIAGGFSMAPIHQTDPNAFAEMMDTNARTAFLCCRATARVMLASNTAGRIVNVTARPGLDARKGAGMVAYAASKAAVAAITVAAAEELKGAGILVNAVAPSTLDTPANRAAMPGADFSKWVGLEAAAEAIRFLISPANEAVSGTLVPLYGRA